MADEKHEVDNGYTAPKEADTHYVAEGHDEEVGIVNKSEPLARDLQGRHMQMIAIGTLNQSSR
jgi:amino acid permease